MGVSYADSMAWKIVPQDSILTFTATQNGAPVIGKFDHFTANIAFDPKQLNESHLEVIIDMNSVSTSDKDIANTLKMPDWFNIKLFPTAIFKADHFTQLNSQNYQARGTLTIRNKAVPILLNFTFQDYSKNSARAKGSVLLKRLAFEVGQGQWANIDSIKDEVKVEFTIHAVK